MALGNDENRLPAGWRWVKLGTICSLVNGDAYKPTDWRTKGAPIIRIQNLNDFSKPFNYWDGPLDGRVIVQPGDVLLAWSGTPGTSFGTHIWNRDVGVLNQHIFRVDFQDGIVDKQWAVHAINQQLYILIGKAQGGVGLRHVTKKEVDSLSILLPSLPEQKRIAAILTEQMAAVEKARAAAEARLKATKELPAAYLREVFESEEARGWARRKIEDIAELLPSKSIATNGNAEVLAITTACLSEIGFLPSGVKVARMNADDASKCIVAHGEILVARSNTPELVGRVAMFEGNPAGAVASDLTIRILPGDDAMSEYLSAYLSFLYLSGYWKERAGGASGSMKKITRGQILAEKVPLPPLEEQRRIMMRLKKKTSGTQQLTHHLQKELTATKELPAALLQKAFVGEL